MLETGRRLGKRLERLGEVNWRIIPIASLVAAAILTLAGCGDSEETTTASEPEAAAPALAEPAPEPAGGDAAIEPGLAPGDPIIEAHELNDWYRAVLIDENAIADPRELEAIARPFCEGLEPCRVGLWYDRADFPTQLPVAELQLRYQVFALGRTIDGTENVLWNCNVFPEFEAERLCLPRPMN